MKTLSTKWFKKWSTKARLSNDTLLEAIRNLEAKLSSAKVGHHLYKVRVKRTHSGKSSGFRTIVVYRESDRAIFLYGFGKNEKTNINKGELRCFRKLAFDLLTLSLADIEKLVSDKVLFDLEVKE